MPESTTVSSSVPEAGPGLAPASSGSLEAAAASGASGTSDPAARHTPVNVLTGFLGSGKTTLLKRLLATQTFANCAVLINELGEIGLDHQLLDVIDQETVLLQNGCICCSIRGDLRRALGALHERRARGVVAFDRVIIETTGLADPVPVLSTVLNDSVLRHHYRLGNVVTTVDAVNGPRWMHAGAAGEPGAGAEAGDEAHTAQAEWYKQVALADRLVITKADLVDAPHLQALRDGLQAINGSALLVVSRNDASDAQILLTEDIDQPSRVSEVRRWFARVVPAPGGALAGNWLGTRIAADVPGTDATTATTAITAITAASAASDAAAPVAVRAPSGRPPAPHRPGVSTLSLVIDEPLDWIAFGVWLSMLLHAHGEAIFRVKGILNIRGSALPLVIHGVQHLIHPPSHLSAWPDDDRRSRLVLIGNLPPAERIRASLAAFNPLSA